MKHVAGHHPSSGVVTVPRVLGRDGKIYRDIPYRKKTKTVWVQPDTTLTTALFKMKPTCIHSHHPRGRKNPRTNKETIQLNTGDA